ncbi:hypothetical protein Tco_0529289 [Tanacetum coccineum]
MGVLYHYPYNTNDPIPTPQGHREHGDDEPRPIRPRPCNYSFEEWLKIRIGHNNLHESDREFIFNEWILDSYDVEEEYAREIGNPYSKRFNEYNRVFNNEIKHLSIEYILRIGKKGYVLDDVWEKCQQNYKKTNEVWHDEGYEEDEMWRRGRSFICITDREDEALPLGRVNGARFKAMIRKELEGNNVAIRGVRCVSLVLLEAYERVLNLNYPARGESEKNGGRKGWRINSDLFL